MIERQEGDGGGARKAQVLGVALVAAILATASLYFAVQGDQPSSGERATTSTSYSALGFRGFATLLEELGFSVIRSRSAGGLANPSGHLAIVTAPRTPAELDRAVARYRRAHAILIVALKRTESNSPDPEETVRRTRIAPAIAVDRTLQAADRGLILERPPTLPTGPAIDRLGVTPAFARPQLARHADAEPVVAYVDGGKPSALVLELQARSPRIWLLADPDPIANHGIGDGDNAIFAARLVEALAGPGRFVVFDEAAEGELVRPTAYARLFELPWLALTLALAALVAAIGLAAAGRFGTPAEASTGIAAGRASLIGATARLQMDRAGARAALNRYMRRTLRSVAQRRHAPGGDDLVLAEWLDGAAGRGAGRRGGEPRASALLHEAAETAANGEAGEARILAVARRIHGWRMDMLDEHGRKRPARPDPSRSR